MALTQFKTRNLQTRLVSVIGKHSTCPFQPLAEMFLLNIFSSMDGLV